MSYKESSFHIIFSTKNREPVLREDKREELYKYIWGILKNKNCHLYRIGGIEDHIHILTSLHPTIALSDLIRDLKRSTTHWIKQENIFDCFEGWQSEYAAFCKEHKSLATVIEYIKNQKEHHLNENSRDELKRILRDEGIPFDDKYLH